MSTVSENIRYLRKLKGYTQEQFAGQIGIKRSLLGAYEEARANPNEIYLESMAEVLGVPVEHLLNEDLRERGRKLGAGTILKLNPVVPEPESRPEKQPEEEKMIHTEEQPVRGAQMDLFAVTEKPVPQQRQSPPADPADQVVRSPAQDIPDASAGFVDMLNSLLSDQKAIRLFSGLDDVPVKDLHLVGERLDKVESIKNNELYIVVRKEGEVLFRRAFNLVEIKGTVILSSDFPEKTTLEIPASAIREVYHYLAGIQTGAPSAVVPARKLKELTAEMMRLLDNA